MRLSLLFFCCAFAWAGDGFISLMPKRDITERWIVDGNDPAEAWTLRNGVIACTGQPNGFLRSKKVPGRMGGEGQTGMAKRRFLYPRA
jgi:hypothetical protein